MGNGVATTTRSGPPPATRLSPKVRRLLRDHRLAAGDVVGTGARGRITPDDVVRTAGGRGTTRPDGRTDQRRGRVLASPLARRLLQEAGLRLEDVVAPGPITRAVAEDVIARGTQATPTRVDAAASAGVEIEGQVEVEVDLTRVLYGVGNASDEVRRQRGVNLTPLAPIAHAACRVLRRRTGATTPDDRADTTRGDIDLGILLDAADGPVFGVLSTAQDLTVAALAERTASLLAQGRAGAAATEAGSSTFVLTGDGWSAAPVEPPSGLAPTTAVLAVGLAEQRAVPITDELGGEATAMRWIAQLRLRRGAGPIGTDSSFLQDLKRELEQVDLLTAMG